MAWHCLRAVCAFVGVAVSYFVGLAALVMFAAFIDSPQPRYAPETSWAELHLVESLNIAGPLAAAAFLAMLVSVVIDKICGNRADLRFYPLHRRMRAVPHSAIGRTVLAIGFLIIVSYLTIAFTAPWLLGSIPKGQFWPAERVLLGLVLVWITIWLAETVVRPVRRPMVAAIIFGVVSLIESGFA